MIWGAKKTQEEEEEPQLAWTCWNWRDASSSSSSFLPPPPALSEPGAPHPQGPKGLVDFRRFLKNLKFFESTEKREKMEVRRGVPRGLMNG